MYFLTLIKRAYFWRPQSKDYISGWFSGTGCRCTCILIIRKSDVLCFYLYQVSVGVLLEKESLFHFTFNKVLFTASWFVYDSYTFYLLSKLKKIPQLSLQFCYTFTPDRYVGYSLFSSSSLAFSMTPSVSNFPIILASLRVLVFPTLLLILGVLFVSVFL